MNPFSDYALLDALLSSIAVLSPEGRIVWANRSFCRLSEQPLENLTGLPLPQALTLAPPYPEDEAGAPLPPEDFTQHLLEHAATCPAECLLLRAGRAELSYAMIGCVSLLPDGHRLLELKENAQAHNLRQQLYEQARRDALTGLLNRQSLQMLLHELHQNTADARGYALLLLDIDRFKVLNDYYGYEVGDEILLALGYHAAGLLDEGQSFGRWSGHEFLCVLPGFDLNRAQIVAEKLRLALKDRFQDDELLPEGGPRELTLSIGVAACRPEDRSPQFLLSRANAALFEAKHRGRNRTVTDDECRGDSIFIAAGLLHDAIREGRLLPAFQPIVELSTRRVVADEALARLITPDGTIKPAGLFIEAASQLQLAHRIDIAIIEQTIQHCSTAPFAGISHFVNISADLLRQREGIDRIMELMQLGCNRCGLEGAAVKPLVIEITEREMLNDTREALDVLRPFIDFGLRLAVDDFGSGYSSFRYLVDLPISFLKIEGELARHAATDRRVRAIIRGIQAIADDLGLITIAEHIEDEATADTLRDMGVAWGQGYLFGRPELASAPCILPR